jgi:hypothetical protein
MNKRTKKSIDIDQEYNQSIFDKKTESQTTLSHTHTMKLETLPD